MLNAQGHSARFHVREAVRLALASEPLLNGIPVVVNPREAISIEDGGRAVVIKEKSDALSEQTGTAKSGFSEKRIFSFSVGLVSRLGGVDADADADADRLHVIASRVVRATFVGLKKTVQSLDLKEQNMQFVYENLEVDGALVATNWEVSYVRNRAD